MDEAKQDNNFIRVEGQFHECFTELSQLVFELNNGVDEFLDTIGVTVGNGRSRHPIQKWLKNSSELKDKTSNLWRKPNVI